MRVDRRLALLLAALALALAGCAAGGPPPIRAGTACEQCGMAITNLGFACERGPAGGSRRGWRRFDSIECLLADASAHPGGAVCLGDYDTRTLHAADSMWVVRGELPSPMGGGYAAFLDRSVAGAIAARVGGRVDRLARLAAAGVAP